MVGFNTVGMPHSLAFVLDFNSRLLGCRSIPLSLCPFQRWCIPFLSILSRVNSHTRTPVNAVWFVVTIAAPLGLLSFAGAQAINAVFSVTVSTLYIAYTIPIAVRWLGGNNFKPFHLGPLVSRHPLCLRGRMY